ncbi:Crp/Fnr family transcriptional regulator [Phenylobacterium terrae]|uniref:Crp/Fnr family transcriptional regulator n=1 Tax=Phenylobacterium terrae TaxID=2665495 RepID=A0ABW4N5Y8_9CAUL
MINRRENWVAELPLQARAALDACAVERCVRAGEVICHAGAGATGVHQVLEGYVKVTGLTHAGDTAVIVIYGPGNCWGESPLVSERPHHHSTIAMTDVRMRTFPKADFLRIYNEFPAVGYALCRKFARAMSRLILNREALAAGRVGPLVAASFLSLARDVPLAAGGNACEIDVPLTQLDVANYLGVTRQSVQPEISALKGAGILEKRSGAWVIHDIRRLRRCSVDPRLT